MSAIIAVLNKKNQNATATTLKMLKALKPKNAENFGIASSSTIKIGKDINDLRTQEINSHIAIGHIFSKIISLDKPQPIRLENATLVFDGRTYPPPEKLSAAEAVAKKLKKNHEETTETLVKETEGDFAFAIAEPEKLIGGRDSMGVRPLYYGENENFAAIASARKALWKIQIEKTNSFPPGHVAVIDKEGFKFKPVKTLVYSEPRRMTMQAAATELQTLLEHSVRERVLDLKEVAVAFSGGLDSSVIAFLAKKSNANVHLIHVSLENQAETENVKKTAEELKLPVNIYLFKEDNVEKTVPRVIRLIEESDPTKTSIGIPLCWTAEKAADMNFKVVLAGQGADELFGGYKRYVDNYLMHGNEKTRKTIFNDIIKLHETNLERDFKILNFHNVELRLPFVTYKIAEFGADLPIELKIEPKQNTLRKLVLRKAAENLGLPQTIVEKPKKAIQYATGTSHALKKIARKQKTTVKDYLNLIFQQIKMVNEP